MYNSYGVYWYKDFSSQEGLLLSKAFRQKRQEKEEGKRKAKSWECYTNWGAPGMVLEKAMAHHSSTLAWKIPWTEEPGRLQSMGSLRVGHD